MTRAALAGACVLLFSARASATGTPPAERCPIPFAAPLPAPIPARRSVLRLGWSESLQPHGAYEVHLFAAGDAGPEIAIDASTSEERTFLVAGDRAVDPGKYRLEYHDDCGPTDVTLDVDLLANRTEPKRTGELRVEQRLYCEGEMTDAGRLSVPLDYPPPVIVRLARDPALEPWLPFVEVCVLSGAARQCGDATSEFRFSTACPRPPEAPEDEHVFTMTAFLPDGVALPAIETKLPVRCPDGCPVDAGAIGDAAPFGTERRTGCATSSGGTVWPALPAILLSLLGLSRLRARMRR